MGGWRESRLGKAHKPLKNKVRNTKRIVEMVQTLLDIKWFINLFLSNSFKKMIQKMFSLLFISSSLTLILNSNVIQNMFCHLFTYHNPCFSFFYFVVVAVVQLFGGEEGGSCVWWIVNHPGLWL